MQVDNELIVEQIQIGPMANFTYLVGSRSTREVAVVDPAWDIDGLLNHIAEQGYTLSAALATHCHPDHIGGGMRGHNIAGVAELLAKNPVKVYAHREEANGVRKVTGLSESDLVKVDSGDKLAVGAVEIEFLHTPGHTPGSQCFRIKNTLVSGDTLFIDGCGRVDLARIRFRTDVSQPAAHQGAPGRHAAAARPQLQRRAQRHARRGEASERLFGRKGLAHLEAGNGLAGPQHPKEQKHMGHWPISRLQSERCATTASHGFSSPPRSA